jgi:hypothetical protein
MRIQNEKMFSVLNDRMAIEDLAVIDGSAAWVSKSDQVQKAEIIGSLFNRLEYLE